MSAWNSKLCYCFKIPIKVMSLFSMYVNMTFYSISTERVPEIDNIFCKLPFIIYAAYQLRNYSELLMA